MAYVHRVVKAGPCVEHKKMQSFRVHTKGVKRGHNTGHTTEKQERINERVAEEHLRWDINANFGHRDLHAVLHYYVKDSSFEEVLENKAAFLRNLRKLCKKRGITFKAVVVIETKRMTNPHIHVIISRMDHHGGVGECPKRRRRYQLQAYGQARQPLQAGRLPDERKPFHHGEVQRDRQAREAVQQNAEHGQAGNHIHRRACVQLEKGPESEKGRRAV